MCKACPIFDIVHPAFPLLTMASPVILSGVLKNGSGEVVTVCDMPKQSKFLFLDSCQKRFLWAHKEIDLELHPVVGLVFHVENAVKFSQAYCFNSLDPFLRFSDQGPCLTAKEEDGGDNRLVQLEPPCEADGGDSPVKSQTLRISAEQLPCLHRVAPRYLK